MGKITASTDIQQVKHEDASRYMDIFAQDVVQQVNGNLTFSDNMKVSFVSFSFTAALTDFVVSHGLGRIPSGYIVVARDQPFEVFYTGPFTSDTMTFQVNVPGTANIMFF